MDCFSKAEIAGIVDFTAFDRALKKLRLVIKVPSEGLDLVAFESDILGETGAVTLIEVEIIDEAFDFLLGKVYDFDYIHVLADIHNTFSRIPIKFVVSGVGQILCHKPHAYLNKEDKGNDVFKVLKCFRLIKKAGNEMKNVPIKFRGVRSDKTKTEVVYGSLLKLGNEYFIVKLANKEIYEREPSNAITLEHINDVSPYNPFLSDYFPCALYPVYEDTVSQLVCYDKDGNEVYEGDEVTDKYGHDLMVVRIEGIAENTNWRKFFRERWTGNSFRFKLKKQGD